MILQALNEYYERKISDPESTIAPIGFELKEIPFLIIIDRSGHVKSLKDTRDKVNGGLSPKKFIVPKSTGSSGSAAWKTSYLLWDHWGYVLGWPKGNAKKDRVRRNDLLKNVIENSPVNEIEVLERLKEFEGEKVLNQGLSAEETTALLELLNTIPSSQVDKSITDLAKNLEGLKKALIDSRKQLQSFKSRIENLPLILQEDEGVSAVIAFYQNREFENVFTLENWEECASINGANLTFQLEGASSPVLSSEAVKTYQRNLVLQDDEINETRRGLCLVTGNEDIIEKIHSSTPIPGGHAIGKLLGFQRSSGFDSYGKEQAFNAPVGRRAHFGYSTALNTLIKSDSNRVLIGETMILFWSERRSLLEESLPLVFKRPPKDDPDRGSQAIKTLYHSIFTGKMTLEEKGNRFYILGLSPNAARISVRFWIVGNVEDIAKNIKQHFDDLYLETNFAETSYIAMYTLLSHTALEYKIDNVAPRMEGQVVESVMRGTPYPRTLLHAVVRRIRAEQSKRMNNRLMQNVTLIRAAIIKACINREARFRGHEQEELTVALDKTNMNAAYRLGRLFAVLERIQSTALGIETIRERYYGSFSSSPITVYPLLMKLKNHHLAKLEKGSKYYYERLVGEIVEGFDGSGVIPRHLTLEEQGKFAVGYYHQRQDLYKGKQVTKPEEEIKESAE